MKINMDIASTVSNLITHLLPNHDGKWVSRRWISDELSPLLQAMNRKDQKTAELATFNAEMGSVFMIMLAVLATFMVLGAILIYFCYRQSGKVTTKVTNGLHYALNEIGARAPNRLPSFSV